MPDPADAWHFGRPALAQDYLEAFELGLTSARGLFARRRMGKTQFLTHDLAPAARERKYLTAYTNLWENADHPGEAIATAIMQAVEPKGIERFWQDLNAPVKKVKGAGKLAGGLEGSLEVDLAEREKIAVPAIQAALQTADRKRKRLLLLIDEAQVLSERGSTELPDWALQRHKR